MSNLNVLKTELQDAAYSGMTDQEAADALNAAQSKAGPFPAKDIGKLLTVRGKVPATLAIAPAVNGYDDIDYSDAAHVTAITHGMDYLIAQGLATDADKTAVLALGDGRMTDPRWKEIGFRHGPVNANQVNAARA